MLAAKLIDHIWATRKADALEGYKLMLVELVGGRNAGERMVAADIISAGIGDRVIVTTGSSARRMLGNDALPIDAVIVGIIDGDCEFDANET
jgi:ethanolamine utilization protein EutN